MGWGGAWYDVPCGGWCDRRLSRGRAGRQNRRRLGWGRFCDRLCPLWLILTGMDTLLKLGGKAGGWLDQWCRKQHGVLQIGIGAKLGGGFGAILKIALDKTDVFRVGGPDDIGRDEREKRITIG